MSVNITPACACNTGRRHKKNTSTDALVSLVQFYRLSFDLIVDASSGGSLFRSLFQLINRPADDKRLPLKEAAHGQASLSKTQGDAACQG